MFDFGIEGYQPHWLSGRAAIMASQGQRLRTLIGRPLTRSWLVWDLQEDERLAECPVLLAFDGDQVEVNHHRFDDLSITWNSVDPGRLVRWTGFDLQWRSDAHPTLSALEGQALLDVELLEWAGQDLARGAVDISFVFAETRLTVFNALDENGLAFSPPEPQHRRHSLG